MIRIAAIATFAVIAAILLARPATGTVFEEQQEATKAERMREGAVFEKVGVFVVAGDRLTFTPRGEENAIRVLENLTLERVSQMVQDSRSKREWKVTGVVTEYRGSNYLLLTHAVMKSYTGSPPPNGGESASAEK